MAAYRLRNYPKATNGCTSSSSMAIEPYCQEFVIGGYRSDGANGVDALLVGYYEGKSLQFAGKVRAGMVPHVRRELLKSLTPLQVKNCPFANLPDSDTGRWGGGVTAEQMAVRGTSSRRVQQHSRWTGGIKSEEMVSLVWVKPIIVVQIRFPEWAADGRLRLASYMGAVADKTVEDVRRADSA